MPFGIIGKVKVVTIRGTNGDTSVTYSFIETAENQVQGIKNRGEDKELELVRGEVKVSKNSERNVIRRERT